MYHEPALSLDSTVRLSKSPVQQHRTRPIHLDRFKSLRPGKQSLPAYAYTA